MKKRSRSLSGIRFEDLDRLDPAPQKADPWLRFQSEFLTLEAFGKLKSLKKLTLKKMFGGLAIYQGDLLCLVLMESPADYRYKDKVADFPIWDGVLVCTDHPHHPKLKSRIPSLINHPILPKWLYLRRNSQTFEKDCQKLTSLILKKSALVGVPKKAKKR